MRQEVHWIADTDPRFSDLFKILNLGGLRCYEALRHTAAYYRCESGLID